MATAEDWVHYSEVAKNVATAIALVAGGVWAFFRFVKQREAVAHLRQHHSAILVPTPYGVRIVRLSILVSNEGKGRVVVTRGNFRAYHLEPYDLPLERKRTKDEQELRWRMIEKHPIGDILGGKIALEPGETYSLSVDFAIENTVTRVMFYSYLKNPDEEKEGWRHESIYDLRERRFEPQPHETESTRNGDDTEQDRIELHLDE